MQVKTFDDIEIRRADLARTYLGLLDAQPGRPIALFAPRRVGKTYFLENDLTPTAQKSGLLPIYADVWLHRKSPLEAINHALEEVLDELHVPKSSIGRMAKTSVKKIGAAGASLEFGDGPRRRNLPAQPELRFDSLISRLAQDSEKCVLLMLDEIQALGETEIGQSAIATLRAVLQKRKRQVRAVFTGSSQEALGEMMVANGGPMYQFAQLMTFPLLGDEYIDLLADHYSQVHKDKLLDRNALRRVFEHIGFKPALMKDLVKGMSAEGITDVDLGLKRFMADDRQVSGWQAIFDGMQPLEQGVLVALSAGMPLTAPETIEALNLNKGINASVSKIRTAARNMRKSGIVSKALRDGYVIEDKLFAEYVHDTYQYQFLSKTRGKTKVRKNG
jgi:hypothetical protein